MGVDIYIYTEWFDGQQWMPFGNFIDQRLQDANFSDRNYKLFDVLAGVFHSNCPNMISPPRGLPDSVSPMIRQMADKSRLDFHCHTYYTLDELLSEKKKLAICPNFIAFLNSLSKSGPDLQDIRLVMWFD